MLLNNGAIRAAIKDRGGMKGDTALRYADRILMNLESNKHSLEYLDNGKFRMRVGAWQWIRDDWENLTDLEKELAVKLIGWMVGGYSWRKVDLNFNADKSSVYIDLYM